MILFLSGVRYYMRGVDNEGHVANYIETEQIVIYHGYKASFVQVRVSEVWFAWCTMSSLVFLARHVGLFPCSGLRDQL